MSVRTLIAAVMLFAPLQAIAQDWKVYSYSDAGFAVQLPAAPTIAKGSSVRVGGVSAPATTYSLQQDGVLYSMIVADFSQTAVDQQGAIVDAVKTYEAAGEVKLNVSERIDRQFGRQLSLVGKDGSRSSISVFFVNQKLYELEGKALPPQPEAGSGKAIRFQQSLEFIGLGAEAFRPENRGPGNRPGRRGPPPEAFEDCRGKEVGSAVQHTTPDGVVVPATCVETPLGLAARPNRPFRNRPPGDDQNAPPPAPSDR